MRRRLSGPDAPGCQFSFACDGKTDMPRNDVQWALAQDIAKQITSGQVWLPEVGYSTFYHANYVSPGWESTMSKIDKIGRHIFYKKRNEKPYIVESLGRSRPPSTVEAECRVRVLATPRASRCAPTADSAAHSSAKSRLAAPSE